MSSQSKTPTQKRRNRRLRSKKTPNSLTNSPTSATYRNSSTPPPPLPRMISTLKTYPPLTSTTSTSPTSTSQISPLTSPSTTPPTTPLSSNRLSMSPTHSPTRRHSTTSVDTVENLQDGVITRNTLSDFDLEVDMLASRAFVRDGEASVYPINPPVSLSTPRLVIDDYLEDVSLHSDTTNTNSSSSRHSLQRATRLSRGTSSIDDHYELVVMPQLEIILDAVRAVQYEVTHLHNELLDVKVSTRHSLKKIWEYLNFSV